MAEAIGGFTFASLEGTPQVPKPILVDITNQEVDGVGFRFAANRAMPFELFGIVDVLTAAGVEQLQDLYAASIGSVVALTVQGVSWNSGFMILDAYIVRHYGGRIYPGVNDGAGLYIVEARFALQWKSGTYKP